MPAVGTKPKPEGQALNRNKPAHEWVEVENVPFEDAPQLPPSAPGGRHWTVWTRRWWDVVSRMPHAVLWDEADWQYAFDTAAAKQLFYLSGGATNGSEVRIREKVMGTTWDARRDLRIRYVDPKEEAPQAVASIHELHSI